jgi:hypothetical protein
MRAFAQDDYGGCVRVHLIDGTYELFRQHFGQMARHTDSGAYGAAAGVVASTLQLVSEGATHVGVASDHVIESFRNDLWAGYKTSAGMDEELLVQIPVMERALEAAGFVTWATMPWAPQLPSRRATSGCRRC